MGVDEITGAACVACGGGHRQKHTVPEAMFRSGEEFTYLECGDCGTLQIAAVPDDLGRYYDTGEYYSFKDRDPLSRRPWLRNPIVRRLLAMNTRAYVATGLGRGLPWTHHARVNTGDRVLDLGCGEGADLQKLSLFGYRHLTGADPFLPADSFAAPGVPLLAGRHDELTGEYDCIVMSHSFEHVADPHATLASVRSLLAPGGRLVIRMPIRDCEAWDIYGVNWVQIDAPRHLVLFTRAGFQTILEAAGLRLVKLVDDSWAFQFWGSELVRAGRPHVKGPVGFSTEQMKAWDQRSDELNSIGRGDSILAVIEAA